jgi:hypothetical protein
VTQRWQPPATPSGNCDGQELLSASAQSVAAQITPFGMHRNDPVLTVITD